MNDLHDLLDTATDQVRSPGLAAGALTTARRRRQRARALVATGAAAALVAAVAVGTQVGTSERPSRPVAPSPSPTASPTPSPPPSGEPTPGVPTAVVPVAPPIDPGLVQPVWDPATVGDLLPTTDVPLPTVLDPPADPPSLDTDPIAAAVAVVDTGEGIAVVDVEGRWREVPRPDDDERDLEAFPGVVTLSPDGTTVVFGGGERISWRRLDGGPWQVTAYPGSMDLDGGWGWSLTPVDARTVLVDGYDDLGGPATWSVDLVDGSVDPDPSGLSLALRAGATAALDGVGGRRVLRLLDDGRVSRSLDVTATNGALLHPVVDGASFVAAREPSSFREPRAGADLDGLLALRLSDGATRAYLPVREDRYTAYYGRAGLTPLAWLDDDVVLVKVVPQDERRRDDGTGWLVTWDVETGELARVASGNAATVMLGSNLVVATALLAGA